MDSGNSGSASLQSSSGGDDEDYDSRAHHHHNFISSLFNPSAAGFTHNFSPPSLLGHHLSAPPLFDPASTYLTSHSPQPDLRRPFTLGSAANCTDLGSFTQQQQQPMTFGPSLVQSPSVFPDNCGTQPGKSPSSDHHHGGGVNNQATVVARNSKKRTRASRRAPTTVLTTDTHNFRAMVQEFTGIPAPPFSASPYSRRLDLFRSSPYPLRPSPHKIHPFNSSSAAANFRSSGPDTNYLNTHNPIESFQSLLQQPQHHKILSSLDDQIQLGAAWKIGSTQHQSRSSDDDGYDNSSSALDHQRINVNGDGTVDSWICP